MNYDFKDIELQAVADKLEEADGSQYNTVKAEFLAEAAAMCVRAAVNIGGEMERQEG